MAFTIAQLRAVGINPATTDRPSFPDHIVLEYQFDGARRSTVAGNWADMFEIPAGSALLVRGAAFTIVRPGTSGCTLGINLGASGAAGTAITGITGVSASAAAGTQTIVLATGANSVIVNSGGASNFAKLVFSTQPLGTGAVRVRLFGELMAAAPAVPTM